MLTRFERGGRLGRVVLIAAGDDHQIDVRIAEDLVVVGTAVVSAETTRDALATHAAGRMNRAQPGARYLPQVGQVRPASE